MFLLQSNQSPSFEYQAPFIANQGPTLLENALEKLLEDVDQAPTFEQKMAAYNKALSLITENSKNANLDLGYPGIIITRFYIDLAWFYLHNANGYGMCESDLDYDAYIDQEYLDKAISSLDTAQMEYDKFVVHQNSRYKDVPEIASLAETIQRMQAFCALRSKVSQFNPS